MSTDAAQPQATNGFQVFLGLSAAFLVVHFGLPHMLAQQHRETEIERAEEAAMRGVLLSQDTGRIIQPGVGQHSSLGGDARDVEAESRKSRADRIKGDKGPKPVSIEQAQSLEDRAWAGDAEAQMAFADLLMDRNKPGQAIHWYYRAAAQGTPRAMMVMGEQYEHGGAVRRSLQDAFAWYSLADEAHSEEGAQAVARMKRSLLRNELRLAEQRIETLRKQIEDQADR